MSSTLNLVEQAALARQRAADIEGDPAVVWLEQHAEELEAEIERLAALARAVVRVGSDRAGRVW